jgi:hypothetical protein
VTETAAEAFDREVPYLAAAPDVYRRRYPLLIDPTSLSLSTRPRGPLSTRCATRSGRPSGLADGPNGDEPN